MQDREDHAAGIGGAVRLADHPAERGVPSGGGAPGGAGSASPAGRRAAGRTRGLLAKPSSPLRIILAAMLVAPALLFVTLSVLQYELGLVELTATPESLLRAIDSPFILLGGLMAAPLLALAPLTTLAWRRDGDRVTASASLTVRWWSIAIAAVSVALLLVLLTYGFLENFQPFHPIG